MYTPEQYRAALAALSQQTPKIRQLTEEIQAFTQTLQAHPEAS